MQLKLQEYSMESIFKKGTVCPERERERAAEVLSWLSKLECFKAISSSFGIVVRIFWGS